MALTQIDDRGLKTPIDFLDNEKIRLGTGNDLQIFHDGSNSFINEVGTGGLYVRAQNTFNLQKAGTSEFMLKATTDGAVELYYDNSKKFETTSSGILVDGDASTGSIIQGDLRFKKAGSSTTRIQWRGDEQDLKFNDSYKATFGGGNDLQIYHDGSHSFIKDTGTGQLVLNTNAFRVNNAADSENMITADENGAVSLFHNDSKKFETTSTGIKVEGDNLELYRYRSYNSDAATYQKIGTNNGAVDNNKVHQWRFGLTGNASAGSSFVFSNLRSTQNTYTEELRLHPDGGISFNGDTAAANALDDYEEGTYTPAALSGGVGTNTDGQYTKIGNFCIVSGSINFDGNGTNSYMASMTLPFTAATGRAGSGSIRYSNEPTANTITFHVNASAANVAFYQYGGSSFTYLEAGTARYDFCITYRTT